MSAAARDTGRNAVVRLLRAALLGQAGPSPRAARRVLVALPLVAASLVATVTIGTTSAMFSDVADLTGIQVTAGSVNDPGSLSLTETGSAVRAAWSAPGAGIVPELYEVFRRAAAGSYGPTPDATVAATTWDDSTAAECETWVYRVRSRHTNLVSGFTGEESIYVDRTAPVAGDAHLYFQGTSELVADLVRVTPGGDVKVYADVTDNCDSRDDIDVSFQFGAPFGATVVPTYSSTGWTPVGGGPTYHWRFDYALPAGSVADGQVVTWNVLATDAAGNSSSTPATPFRGDGTGPVLDAAVLVSGVTDWYDSAWGVGEVNSWDTSVPVAVRNAGSHACAGLSDGAGVESATLDATALRTGAAAIALTPGSYTAANGDAWSWMSTTVVPNRDRPDQSVQTFTVTATDRLGNAATSSPVDVLVDDVRPAAANTSCQNVGTNDGSLAAPDHTLFSFQDTLVPSGIRAGWDGSTITATATLRNGTRDYVDLNGDFGLDLMRGTAYNRSWNLNNRNWTTSDLAFPGSTFGFEDRRTLRLDYAGASTSTAPSVNATASFGTAGILEASGNTPSGNFNETCTTAGW